MTGKQRIQEPQAQIQLFFSIFKVIFYKLSTLNNLL